MVLIRNLVPAEAHVQVLVDDSLFRKLLGADDACVEMFLWLLADDGDDLAFFSLTLSFFFVIKIFLSSLLLENRQRPR